MFKFNESQPRIEKIKKNRNQNSEKGVVDKKKEKGDVKIEKAEKYLKEKEREFKQFNQIITDLIVYEDLTYEDVLEKYQQNFNDQDAEIYADMWDNYWDLNRNVQKFMNKTWDECGQDLREYDYKAVEKIFGFKPEGYFEVEDTAMGAVIIFYKKSDYVQAEGGEINNYRKSLAQYQYDEKNNIGVIFIQNQLGYNSGEYLLTSKKHEEKHLLAGNILDMNNKWQRKIDAFGEKFKELDLNKPKLITILTENNDAIINYFSFNGLDEALAYLYNGTSLADTRDKLLNKNEIDNVASYDYFDWFQGVFDDLLNEKASYNQETVSALSVAFKKYMDSLRPQYEVFIKNLMEELDLIKTAMEFNDGQVDRDKLYVWLAMDAKRSDSADDFLSRVQKLRKSLYLAHIFNKGQG